MSSFAQTPGGTPSRPLRTHFAVSVAVPPRIQEPTVVACGKGGLGSGPGPKRGNARKWQYPSYARTAKAKAEHRKGEKAARRDKRLLNLGFNQCLICQEIILHKTDNEADAEVRCRRPCSAYFHKGCADEWLKGVSSCPQCMIVPMFEGGPEEAPQAAAFRNETMQIWEGDGADSDDSDWSDDGFNPSCCYCQREASFADRNDAYDHEWDDIERVNEWSCPLCTKVLKDDEDYDEESLPVDFYEDIAPNWKWNNFDNAAYWASRGYPFWNENAMGGPAYTKRANDRRTPAYFSNIRYLSKHRFLLRDVYPGTRDFKLDQYAAPPKEGTMADRLNADYWEANGFEYNEYLHRWVVAKESKMYTDYKGHSPSSACKLWSNLYDASRSKQCAICKKENAPRWLHFLDEDLSVCCMEDFFIGCDTNRFLQPCFRYKPSYLQICSRSHSFAQEVWPIYEESDEDLVYRVTGYYFINVNEAASASETVSGNDELSRYFEDEKVVQTVKDAPLQKTILTMNHESMADNNATKVKDVVRTITELYENGREMNWYTLGFHSFTTNFGRGEGGSGLSEEQKQGCLDAIARNMRAKGLRPATQDFESWVADNIERMQSFPDHADFFRCEDEIYVRPLQLAYYIKKDGVLW